MSRTSAAATLVAVALASVMLFVRLGGLPLQIPDEARNAEVAREMRAAGAWLVPTYDDVPYLDKPAFFFKAVALSFSLLGESEAAARVPSALSALLLVLLVYGFCRRVYDRGTATLAVAVLAVSPMFVGFGRAVIFDMMLGLFVSASIVSGHLAEVTEGPARRWWSLASAGAAGLATLVKGPVGFLVPLLVLAAAHLVEGRRDAIRRLFAPGNVAVFLGLVLPWFLGVTYYEPDFPYYGLVVETFRRYTTDSFHRAGPVYYYVPVLLGLFFAWSLLLPGAAVAAWRARSGLTRTDRLLMVWAVVVLLFFSSSGSKLPGYILTAVVALSVLCARLFLRAGADPGGRAARVVFAGTWVLLAVAGGAAAIAAAEVLRPGLVSGALHVEPAAMPTVRPYVVSAIAPLLAVLAVAVAAVWRRAVPVAFAAFLLMPALGMWASFDAVGAGASARSARPLAERLSTLPAATEIACLECFPHGVPFYLKRPVTVFSDHGGALSSNYVTFELVTANRWPDRIVPVHQARAWIDSRPAGAVVLAHARAPLVELVARRGVTVEEAGRGWWSATLPAPGSR